MGALRAKRPPASAMRGVGTIRGVGTCHRVEVRAPFRFLSPRIQNLTLRKMEAHPDGSFQGLLAHKTFMIC